MRSILPLVFFMGMVSYQAFAVEHRFECTLNEVQEIREGLGTIQIIHGPQYLEEVYRTLNNDNLECVSLIVPGDIVPRGGKISRFELWYGAKAHFLKIVHYKDPQSSYIALERLN